MTLTHHFTFLKSLGGVQSVLQGHVQGDTSRGLESRFVIFFEPNEASDSRTVGMGWNWKQSIRSARVDYLKQVTPSDISVFHNCWGLPFLGDLDPSRRRIGVIHSDWPGMERTLVAQRGMLDGLLCVSRPLVDAALRCLPELGPDRIDWIPYPVHSKAIALPDSRSPGTGPIRIGFVGRLIREQKRVERLVPLVKALEAAKVPFHLEILGEGPERAWLEKAFRNRPDVALLGRLEGEAYWRTLAGWDVVVYVSDFEGLPISMLEALSLGVLPLHPRIGTGGDDYAERIDKGLVYPPEDLNQAAASLLRLHQMPVERWTKLREEARLLAAPHLGDSYYDRFSEFANHIAESPRISREHWIKRPNYWSDFCPFGILRRICMSGFLRSNEAISNPTDLDPSLNKLSSPEISHSNNPPISDMSPPPNP